jgi:hypothetical protein
MMMSRQYKLPLGGQTNDVDEYVKAWTDLASPLAELLEMTVYGFDPAITLNTGVAMYPTVTFAPSKAKILIEKFKTIS